MLPLLLRLVSIITEAQVFGSVVRSMMSPVVPASSNVWILLLRMMGSIVMNMNRVMMRVTRVIAGTRLSAVTPGPTLLLLGEGAKSYPAG